MATVTKRPKADRETIVAKTRTNDMRPGPNKWWKADGKEARGLGLVSTAAFLKEQLQYRYRQASIFSRLYGNIPLFGATGSSLGKISTATTQLPVDRPTMNVVQSCVDTLVSRITQSRPRPVFLTDNGDYKARNLAKKLNQFINGELYQTGAYELCSTILRDASVLGSGCIKVYESQDHKVALERVLLTELLVDPNDSLYGHPRQLYQLKLVDREVLAEMFPKERSTVQKAEQAYPDAATDSKTVSDQVMVVEGWHLPSGKDSGDGRHTIACTSGTLVDEEFTKDKFPFVFLHYSPRMLGFFGQGLAEQLMGTQIEINKLLITISKSINLVGVPRVFVEDGSKVVKAHLNNEIGSIVTYRGTKPQYEVAPCVPQELYTQLQRLVEYAYQQSGVSALAATSKKPAGLDSGAAIREYDELQSDRFATLNKRYDNLFIDLAYLIIEAAKDIAEEQGKYQSVYPNKNGTKEIDLPKIKELDDPFVIQCFDSSALPRDPAGRMQKIVEMMQAGMISVQEGRRLLDYPDLDASEKLANASEERILKILDEIVEEGKYTPPDPFMNLTLAKDLSNQYYNLYVGAKLEEDRAEMIRTFNGQAITLMQAGMQPSPASPAPQAAPMAPPTSPMIPNSPNPTIPQ